MTDQFSALLGTVLDLRKNRFGEIPEALVRELLSLQADSNAADAGLYRMAQDVLERHLREGEGDAEDQ